MNINLVLSAHADVEVIHPGRIILQYIANGNRVHVVFITDGVRSRGAGESNQF
jgi:LmbE family N-acetylglucosaminyl deacetylase